MGFGHEIPHRERFVKNNKNHKIYGHDQTRAFCYIDDAVQGTIQAMESKKTNGEIYHIGNPQEISMETLTTYIGNLLNYRGEYIPAITYPGSVSRRCPDISKASEDFGFEPINTWEQAVRLTSEWYQAYFREGNLPIAGGFESPETIYERSKI